MLIIGFGRFGQIVSQCFLTQGVDVTAVDIDTEMIDAAGRFGFRVYYGDGRRLDVLRAAGAGRVPMIAVCVDDRDTATQIVDVVNEQFPDTKLYVRAFDRTHTLELIRKGVNFELRETLESALAFGAAALEGLGVDAERAEAVADDVRRRDLERLALQKAGGFWSGRMSGSASRSRSRWCCPRAAPAASIRKPRRSSAKRSGSRRNRRRRIRGSFRHGRRARS